MRIQNKLFTAILLAGIGLVALMYILMEWTLTRGLVEFINTKEKARIEPLTAVLVERYQARGGWQWIDGRHRLFHNLYRNLSGRNSTRQTQPAVGEPSERIDDRYPRDRDRGGDVDRRPPPSRDGGFRPGRRPPPHHDRRGEGPRPPQIALFDAHKRFLAGDPNARPHDNWIDILLEDKTIGYLVVPNHERVTEGYELTLLEQQRESYIVISLLLICLTIVVAMPLARNLVQPIKQLAGAMNRLTRGDYETRLKLKRDDELGQLSRDVNELAMTLDKTDTARKRWLADISHELRTPIAVLKGEMEAVIDGVRQPDIKQVESSYQEVQRLQRLVEDLYELSSADIGGMKYRKEPVDLQALLEDEIPLYEQLLAPRDIAINVRVGKKALVVYADADRLYQLFKNILVNSAKYGRESGEVHLTLERVQDTAQITFEDDGPGVPEDHLDKLFEHLYRVDDSRNRETGGSGLGLAICRQIVEAHEGTIEARRSALGGLCVIIRLPLQ